MQVCHAVQHAHQKGLIHRNIKPSNVLVMLQDGKPVPKVIDFGVAKATNQRLAEHTVFTEIGQLIGTPEYMSPEQAEMSQLDIDTRTDIYSLGVLLYELLTGALPFDSKTLRERGYAEVRRIIREVEPPRPSTRLSSFGSEPSSQEPGDSQSRMSPSGPTAQPSAPSSIDDVASRRQTDARTLIKHLRGDLDWIVMKCVEKDRTRRYDTASGLALELQRYLKNEPVTAGAPTLGYRMHKFVRRNRAAVIAVSAVVISLMSGLGGIIWQARQASIQSRRANDRAEVERLAKIDAQNKQELAVQKTAEAEQARAAETKAREHNSYLANVKMAAAAMDLRQFDRLRQHLDACPLQLRGWEWGWLNAEENKNLPELKGRIKFLRSASFSSDGTRSASRAELNGHTEYVRTASFSPDGTRIVTTSNEKTARVWDTSTGASLAELNGHMETLQSASFSPDGTRIVTASDDKTARV